MAGLVVGAGGGSEGETRVYVVVLSRSPPAAPGTYFIPGYRCSPLTLGAVTYGVRLPRYNLPGPIMSYFDIPYPVLMSHLDIPHPPLVLP